MSLSNAALRHLQHVADLPDLTSTRYELIEPLGRGGMGAIYRVADRALGREVALKVVHGAADPASLARLTSEARILAQLEHPGIVPVHDVGTLPDGRLFYVMKLVRGDRLDVHAPRGGATAQRLRLLISVADAVAFAHAHGIVHRDLTPANIMVGPFGEVLVMDWGLAFTSAQPDHPDQTRPNPPEPDQPDRAGPNLTEPEQPVLAGTPGFMAPEQAGGAADSRSDIYALGAMLRWYLSAERGGPARLPRPVRSIADKACASDPGARYQSADAFAADLSHFLDAQPVGAHRESAPERTIRLARTYRVAILLVLGYLVMRMVLLMYRGL